MVAVVGLETNDIKSPEMKTALEKLGAEISEAQKAAAENKTSSVDVNKSLTSVVEKAQELAKNGDPDANYALGKWALSGMFQNATAEAAMASYKAASDKGHIAAKAELAGLMMQAFPQDAEKVKEAVGLILDAEKAGNKDARRALAQLTLQGAGGVTQSVDTAKALLEKGSGEGDGAATLMLSQLLGAGVADAKGTMLLKKDEKEALALLTKASEQGNPQAMSQLAANYFQGANGLPKDPDKALKMFKDAAAKGSAAANNSLGLIYEQGLLGEGKQDIKEAVKYYLAAAQGGDATAQLKMGNYLETGLGIPDEKDKAKVKEVVVAPNPKGALDYYRVAAQSGLAEANYNVGAYYEAGNVLDRDLPKAFAFYQRAALGGLPAAQHKLGAYYQNGLGIGRDIVAAVAWYEKAAQNKFPMSQLVLGAMAELGVGKEQSDAEAAIQYGLAAEQGMPLAMIRLASLYERGRGQKQPDRKKAWVWAQRAVDASNNAKEAVAYRDALEKGVPAANGQPEQPGMSAADLAEAKKAYEQLKTEAPAAAPTGATAPAAAPAAEPSAKKKTKTK